MAYRDQVRVGATHGERGRFNRTGIDAYQRPTVAMTGTAGGDGCTEAQVVSGGQTIILTLTNGVWNKNTAAFEAARQAMIDGMDSAQVEAAGWDVKIKGAEVVGAIVRTSDTVVTITLTAASTYVITADETITITIPAALMEGQLKSLGAGTFAVANA